MNFCDILWVNGFEHPFRVGLGFRGRYAIEILGLAAHIGEVKTAIFIESKGIYDPGERFGKLLQLVLGNFLFRDIKMRTHQPTAFCRLVIVEQGSAGVDVTPVTVLVKHANHALELGGLPVKVSIESLVR